MRKRGAGGGYQIRLTAGIHQRKHNCTVDSTLLPTTTYDDRYRRPSTVVVLPITNRYRFVVVRSDGLPCDTLL